MIETKVKVPQKSLIYKYDKDFDVLDIFIEKVVPSFSEELYNGIYTYFDMKTEDIVGVSIMNYKDRDRKVVQGFLPFYLNFDYIDKIVIN